MSTIDVGDNDQVFVFTRSLEPNPPKPMIHEFGRDDLLIIVERRDPVEDGIQCVPRITIYVGGEPVGLVQEINLNASSGRPVARLEVKILSSEVEGLSDQVRTGAYKTLELLKRLIPFVNIKEMGFEGEVLNEQGLDLSTNP